MKKVDHEKDRIEQMDIARGMGILLVVLGHNHVCASGTAMFLSIYSFHVPLFFFLSGLFHKRQVSLTKDICKRAKKLLLPYFATGLGFAFYKVLESPEIAKMLFFGIAWGAGGSGTPISFLYWPPVWFLTSLFLTQVLFSALQPAFSKTPVGLRVLASALFLMVGVWYLHTWGVAYFPNTRILPNEIGLFWNLDLLPATIFFYWLGWECGKEPNMFHVITIKSSFLSLIIYGALYAGFLFLHLSNGGEAWALDLNRRQYGHFLMTTLGAILGILLTLGISNWLAISASPPVRKALAYIGMHSLVILIFHDFFQQQATRIAVVLSIPTWATNTVALLFGTGAPLMMSFIVLQRIAWLRKIYGIPEFIKP